MTQRRSAIEGFGARGGMIRCCALLLGALMICVPHAAAQHAENPHVAPKPTEAVETAKHTLTVTFEYDFDKTPCVFRDGETEVCDEVPGV